MSDNEIRPLFVGRWADVEGSLEGAATHLHYIAVSPAGHLVAWHPSRLRRMWRWARGWRHYRENRVVVPWSVWKWEAT